MTLECKFLGAEIAWESLMWQPIGLKRMIWQKDMIVLRFDICRGTHIIAGGVKIEWPISIIESSQPKDILIKIA